MEQAQTSPPIHNIEVLFISPNAAAKSQPMDKGVIDDLKMRFHTFLMDWASNLADINDDDTS